METINGETTPQTSQDYEYNDGMAAYNGVMIERRATGNSQELYPEDPDEAMIVVRTKEVDDLIHGY